MEEQGPGTVPTWWEEWCQISPSDLIGQVDNLVKRIEDLEQTVSELSAANVSAIQLSDLSQQAGWITGVTYLGVEGWTQTPYGTLIPPDGWAGLSSIIDGSEGTIVGGASLTNYIIVQGTAMGFFEAGNADQTWTATIKSVGNIATRSTNYITIANNGYYLLLGEGVCWSNGTTGTIELGWYTGAGATGSDLAFLGGEMVTNNTVVDGGIFWSGYLNSGTTIYGNLALTNTAGSGGIRGLTSRFFIARLFG